MNQKNSIVTIHQPTFFPWYPFFQKIEAANVFVFLTHCQFEKNGYQNRFDINKKWYTMSSKRGLIPINEKCYINPIENWKKIKTNLKRNEKISHDLLSEFDNCFSASLCNTNIKIIKKIKNFLNIETSFMIDEKTFLKGDNRLIDICSKVEGCNQYLSGIGGKKYLDESKFKEENINIVYQKESDMIKKPILEYLSEKY